MSEVREGLSASECGFVLAAALEGRGGAELCAGLAGETADRCRVALEALDVLPAGERGAALGRLAHRALAAIPQGIEEVHPSWLEAAFTGERPEVLRAVLAGAPAALRAVALPGAGEGALQQLAPEAVADLRRAALASIVPALGGGEAARLRAMPPGDLEDELRRRGADVLGASLRGSPREVVARAAALAGERWCALVMESAGREAPATEREQARTIVAAATTLGRVDPLLGAGLLDTARRLRLEGGDEAVRQVAQRLPHRIGRLMLPPRP